MRPQNANAVALALLACSFLCLYGKKEKKNPKNNLLVWTYKVRFNRPKVGKDYTLIIADNDKAALKQATNFCRIFKSELLSVKKHSQIIHPYRQKLLKKENQL